MSDTSNLSRVLLSWPTLVHLGTTTTDADAPAQSWVQLAVAGAFESTRYGTFAITPDDLGMMAANFRPGVTPIDYDHLSMDATKPFDGIAAGWLQGIELRDGGTALWGLVEWTPDAATRIEHREYRFISPSFMKDYTTATGEKVGTKLLAAALTNLPFLPEMAAVTLGGDAVFGQFALRVPADRRARTRTVHHLAELGQRVTFRPDAERTPELSDEERRQTFIVKSTIGAGEDQFVRLTRPDGTEFGWFRVSNQLAPAPAPQPERTTQEDNTMQDTKTTDIEQQAAQFARRVAQKFALVRDWATAFTLAQDEDESGAEAYRRAGIGADTLEPEPPPVLSLSARPNESFDDLATRYAIEKGVSLREAVREVGRARPDLAAGRG